MHAESSLLVGGFQIILCGFHFQLVQLIVQIPDTREVSARGEGQGKDELVGRAACATTHGVRGLYRLLDRKPCSRPRAGQGSRAKDFAPVTPTISEKEL